MLFESHVARAEQALAVQVFHPNIDLEGNVCLNILREDWKPVLSINSVIYGLQFLFLVSPSPVLAQSIRRAASVAVWEHPCADVHKAKSAQCARLQ